MWRETTQHERNLLIFQREFEDFLPEKILDGHVHIFPEGTILRGGPFSCAGHPIMHYDLNELSADLSLTYPNRQTAAICFGFPDNDYDMPSNNRYVAAHCDHKHFFPFRLFDPNETDHSAVRRDIIDSKFVGLKPYLNYVRKPDPNDVTVFEMLPPWIMEIANELALPITLHIPRKGRLADPLNQQQVIELCRNYPKTNIILAHIGRAYSMNVIVGHLENLKNLPNLYYDLAMLNSWEVLEYLFQQVPHEKIIYGTDAPIALAPGKSVEINDQYTYVTPVPWSLSISDDHKKLIFTSFLYEEMRAIKKAVGRCGLGRDFVEDLFWGNAMRVLGQGMR